MQQTTTIQSIPKQIKKKKNNHLHNQTEATVTASSATGTTEKQNKKKTNCTPEMVLDYKENKAKMKKKHFETYLCFVNV